MNPQHLSFERKRFKWASICSRRFLVDNEGDDDDKDDDDNDEGSGDCDVRVDDEGLRVEEDDDDDDLPLVYCGKKNI
jgi:hypothetical protein